MRAEKNKRIFAFITNRCNCACKYCFVYDGEPHQDMSLSEFEALCEIGKGRYQYITFIGGEPLLHPKLYELMIIAINYGYKISISTAGIEKFDNRIDQIFNLPIDDVTISMDSNDEKTNDYLRGKGALSRATETALFLKQKGIEFRVTATICSLNKSHIFSLAQFVYELGAVQLDIHVMSQKGRASSKHELSLAPSDWYSIRCLLDRSKFFYPFNISYPIMWCKHDEHDLIQLLNYCDAHEGNRLSVMSDCTCYYCTIAIGFGDFSSPLEEKKICKMKNNYSKLSSLCEVEKRIGTSNDGFLSLCRFIKRRTGYKHFEEKT